MKYIILLLVFSLVVTLAVVAWWLFPDAKFEKKFAEGFGSPQYIRCYSGNGLILEDVSTGKVYSEGSSDGYYWKSRLDGKLYEASADCIFRTATSEEMDLDYTTTPQYRTRSLTLTKP